jgi:hypothetical protein
MPALWTSRCAQEDTVLVPADETALDAPRSVATPDDEIDLGTEATTMGNDDKTFGVTDTDQVDDTEGHDARRQFPAPPVLDGEDNWPQGLVGDTGQGRAELDTEGHALPQRTGEGAVPQRPGPGEHLDGDADTEGHLLFRRRPGEAGE